MVEELGLLRSSFTKANITDEQIDIFSLVSILFSVSLISCPTYVYIFLKESISFVGEFNQKFQPVRNKTNRENTRQRKQSHAQDNIYVVRQFAYVHGVAGISL